MSTGEWRLEDSTTQLKRLTNQLAAYFKRRIPAHEDPLDYVNTVWVAAGKGFRGESSLHHYLFQIARRLVSDSWRKESKTPELAEWVGESEADLPSDAPGCETALTLYKGHEAMDRALQRVDPVFRRVLELWLVGRDGLAIADELGIHRDTVRSRLSRGRRILYRYVLEELDK